MCCSLFFLFYVTTKLWGLYILLGNNLLTCLQRKHHRTQVVWSLLDCLPSSMPRLFLHFFILLTNLFALYASSMVEFLIFPSKSQHSKRISGLVSVANQLNCPIKARRLGISVSLSKSLLSFFPSNFKDSTESISLLWEITKLLSPSLRSKPGYQKAFLFTEPISKILCNGLITFSTRTCDPPHKKSSTFVTRSPCRVPLY